MQYERQRIKQTYEADLFIEQLREENANLRSLLHVGGEQEAEVEKQI